MQEFQLRPLNNIIKQEEHKDSLNKLLNHNGSLKIVLKGFYKFILNTAHTGSNIDELIDEYIK